MNGEDAETRGGERPADWKGPGDAPLDPLAKGGEPAGVRGDPLIDVLAPEPFVIGNRDLAPVETHHEDPPRGKDAP